MVTMERGCGDKGEGGDKRGCGDKGERMLWQRRKVVVTKEKGYCDKGKGTWVTKEMGCGDKEERIWWQRRGNRSDVVTKERGRGWQRRGDVVTKKRWCRNKGETMWWQRREDVSDKGERMWVTKERGCEWQRREDVSDKGEGTLWQRKGDEGDKGEGMWWQKRRDVVTKERRRGWQRRGDVVTKERECDDKGEGIWWQMLGRWWKMKDYLVADEIHCCDAVLRLRKRLLTYRELEKYLLYSVHDTRNGNDVLQWSVMPGCKITWCCDKGEIPSEKRCGWWCGTFYYSELEVAKSIGFERERALV